MPIALLILLLSSLLTARFMALAWRAKLVSFAENGRIREAASDLLNSKDFQGMVAYLHLCPDFVASSGPSPSSVVFYHRILHLVDSMAILALDRGNARSINWIKGELALCERYATVVFIQRLECMRGVAAEVQSY